jgi:nucleotide-binding universal stress UspA family protein
VIETGTAIAETSGLRPVFTNVAQIDLAASPAVMPAGAGVAWAPFAAGGYHRAERRAAERSAEFLAGLGIPEADARVITGNPTKALHDLAKEIDAHAIVVGRGPRSRLKAMAVGSVARWLAVNGSVPVAFARPAERVALSGPVVCGVDAPSRSAPGVAAAAAHFARLLGRRLVLVHVAHSGAGDGLGVLDYARRLDEDRLAATESLDRIARRLPDDLGIEVVVDDGPEAGQLTRQADERNASLLVTGNRGRGSLRSALVGSVSLELAHTAGRPVVVVPPNAPQSPSWNRP